MYIDNQDKRKLHVYSASRLIPRYVRLVPRPSMPQIIEYASMEGEEARVTAHDKISQAFCLHISVPNAPKKGKARSVNKATFASQIT